MIKPVFLIIALILFSCNEKQDKVVAKPEQTNKINVAEELAKIEQVRKSFGIWENSRQRT